MRVSAEPRFDAVEAGRQTCLRKAALAATEHGWPVLPGSEWHGHRYRNAITGASTRRLVPVVPRQYATIEEHQVRAWWADLPHSVLLVTGKTFDVLSVPTAWGKAAIQHILLRRNPAPMIQTPDRRAHFVVATGPSIHSALWHPAVELSEPGSVVPVPPTRMVGHLVKWEIPPERTGWQPGDPANVQEALLKAAGIHRT